MSTAQPSIALLKDAEAHCTRADLGLGAYLGDIASAKDGTLTCGIYVQKAAEKELAFTYKYSEIKIVLEGELHVTDTVTSHKIVATKGDAINIDKGANLLFSSPSQAKIFFVGNRGPGEL